MTLEPALRNAISRSWVVIPLYNEATVITSVITELREVFANIVCVNDGSSDDSESLARAAGARVVTHPINLGQGAALQTGFAFAREHEAQYVITFDADGQHRVEDALTMLRHAVDTDTPIVFGSRFLGTATNAGAAKRIVLKTAVALTNLTTRTRLTDTHNGLRVIREDALSQLKLKQDRMAHGTEIIAQLAKTGLPYAELPVTVVYTDYSKAKGQSLLNSVNILIDLLIR